MIVFQNFKTIIMAGWLSFFLNIYFCVFYIFTCLLNLLILRFSLLLFLLAYMLFSNAINLHLAFYFSPFDLCTKASGEITVALLRNRVSLTLMPKLIWVTTFRASIMVKSAKGSHLILFNGQVFDFVKLLFRDRSLESTNILGKPLPTPPPPWASQQK